MMNKFFLTLAALSLILFTSSNSAHTSADIVAGKVAPQIALSDTVSLSDMQGRYVVLCFWNSTDAASRLTGKQFDKTARDLDPEGRHIAVIGVNTSDNTDIFDGIVTLDRLDKKSQFHLDGDAAQRTSKAYHLDDNTVTGSLLIAPDGTIAAVNPAPADLARLL